MLLLPPRSTLFPYTTLFRSHLQEFVLLDAATCNIYSTQQYDGFIHLYNGGNFNPAAPLANCIDGDDDDNLGRGNSDRKSTRLNSSHGYISYAVFCLKKKKKI